MIERTERVILTPEHVPIRLTPAGLGSRFLAVLLDFFIASAIVMLVARLAAMVLPSGLATAFYTTTSFVVLTGYHIWFEVRSQGRTLGKRATGLRVVDGRGLPITLEQSFVRNVVRVLDFLPVFYGAGGLVSLIDRDRRRLGDILADTLVVQERRPLLPQGELRLDRRYNTLSAPALRRRIKQRVSLEEREFLLSLCLRADRLTESARYDLMEQVGDHYRRRLDIFDPHLSNENLVRDLTAVLYGQE